jgi:hypothetical protein
MQIERKIERKKERGKERERGRERGRERERERERKMEMAFIALHDILKESNDICTSSRRTKCKSVFLLFRRLRP